MRSPMESFAFCVRTGRSFSFLTLLLIHFLNNVIDTLLRLVYTNFAMRNNINTH